MSFREGSFYARDGGKIVALGATTVEQTGMVPGTTYEFTVSCAGASGAGSAALCRWGADDASAADGGFDFAVPSGSTVRAVCPTGDTAINIVESDAGTVATAQVLIARVSPR